MFTENDYVSSYAIDDANSINVELIDSVYDALPDMHFRKCYVFFNDNMIASYNDTNNIANALNYASALIKDSLRYNNLVKYLNCFYAMTDEIEMYYATCNN